MYYIMHQVIFLLEGKFSFQIFFLLYLPTNFSFHEDRENSIGSQEMGVETTNVTSAVAATYTRETETREAFLRELDLNVVIMSGQKAIFKQLCFILVLQLFEVISLYQ